MSEPPRFPEPRDSQEIRELFERHDERASNVAPIVSIGNSLMVHFNLYISKEIDDIRRQIEIVEPWFPVSEEKKELDRLENQFEMIRGRLNLLLNEAKDGKIRTINDLDINAIVEGFQTIDGIEQLWNKVRRWSMSLLRQSQLFRHWLDEMLPKEEE